MNHQNIKNRPERIANLAPFKDKCNFIDINFPAGIKDWKTFEKNNETIVLNIVISQVNIEVLHILFAI